MKINYSELEYNYKLPDCLRFSPFANLGLKYDRFLQQYTPAILDKLNDPSNLEVRNQVDGKPIRSVLKDNLVCKPIVDFFANEFDGEVTSVHVNRSHVIDINSNQSLDVTTSEVWISEFWHIDNVHRPTIAIGIYLTDVDNDSAPMTYEDPPEDNFYSGIEDYTDWKDSRFPNFAPANPINIIGPKHTTFVFIPNFLHKANYARKRHRDALFIRLLL